MAFLKHTCYCSTCFLRAITRSGSCAEFNNTSLKLLLSLINSRTKYVKWLVGMAFDRWNTIFPSFYYCCPPVIGGCYLAETM